jgi:hypothetical protein
MTYSTSYSHFDSGSREHNVSYKWHKHFQSGRTSTDDDDDDDDDDDESLGQAYTLRNNSLTAH